VKSSTFTITAKGNLLYEMRNDCKTTAEARVQSLLIDGREFSERNCLVIGEVAQAHDGSLGMAHAFIDAIAAADADAVKFQTHIAAAESTPGEPWRVKFSTQDATRYDYWKRMEFSEPQWHELKQHATQRGLLFLSSPFSFEAVELLTRVGVAAWKVASGEVNNTPLLERMTNTGLPILISSGMSTLTEIDSAVAMIRSRGRQLAVMQCTSAYPCPPERVGLDLIDFFRQRYNCAAGLSDHTGTIYSGLAAAALGVDVLEVHVTLSREMFGPDVPVSVTTSELRTLVEGIRFIERINASDTDKDQLTAGTAQYRELFTKSVVARIDLPAGTLLSDENLTLKKPGTGIPANRLAQVIGMRVKKNYQADELLSEADLEKAN
jgi:N,N'-diacetyllegionaminate synthase